MLIGCGHTRALDASYLPLRLGSGARYRPPATSRRVGRLGRLTCKAALGPRVGIHLELFANRRVVLIPAGIGMAVSVHGCYYPLVTREPTGVFELSPDVTLTLADLFRVWGQPLKATRLAGFGGGYVRAYVDGQRGHGDPGAIVLRRHAEIVLEIAGHVPPHRSYRFASGL